jgi:sugar phosphate isomerase/epimerase
VELALNTATVRKQWNLAQIIDGCARHEIRGISPWRDQVAALGLQETKTLIKKHGLTVTGLCRGGFFAEKDWKSDNLRAIEEAHELGAPALILVVGALVGFMVIALLLPIFRMSRAIQ